MFERVIVSNTLILTALRGRLIVVQPPRIHARSALARPFGPPDGQDHEHIVRGFTSRRGAGEIFSLERSVNMG